MIRVCLVTSWGSGCGTSECAKNIVDYVKDRDISITVEMTPIAHLIPSQVAANYDIIHLNESGHACGGVTNEHITRLRQAGVKTLLTMNASHPENNWNPWTKSFDQVAVFEPRTTDGYNYVPLWAPMFEPRKEIPRHKWITTNGFPQERKNLFALAEACQATGYRLVAFIPNSQHADANAVSAGIQQRNPGAVCYTDWKSPQEICSIMEECSIAAYPYIEWLHGASSAPMFGVSARIPLLVSRCMQFNYLFEEKDGVYFIESPRPTVQDCIDGILTAERDSFSKSTERLYEEHRSDDVGKRWAAVYRKMCPEKIIFGESTRGETMKTGVKSLQVSDYNEFREEFDQLNWILGNFRGNTNGARIDACDTLGHQHRMWEWCRVLMLLKQEFGYPFPTEERVQVLDVGTAYSLIGPALSYLGCRVLETDVDANAYMAERFKVKEFLDKHAATSHGAEFDWIQMGFGRLHELDHQFDVVMSISTIEHVETSLELKAWKEMYDRLKPGGIMIVTMDCFVEAKKGYIYDDVRYTNYDMALVKTRVDELKSYGMQVIGDEDYTWYGNHVDDGSFSWISMRKPNLPKGALGISTKIVEVEKK